MLTSILRALRLPRRLREGGDIFDRVAALQAPDTCDTCQVTIPAGHYAVKHYRHTLDDEDAVHVGTTCLHDFGIRVTLPRSIRVPRRWPVFQPFLLRFTKRIG